MYILILLIVLCILLFTYFEYLFHYTREAKLISNVPGPYKVPIFGNVLNYLHGPIKMFATRRHFCNTHKEGIYFTQLAHKRVLNICNPYDAEIILTSSKYITKSSLYNFLHPWLKTGLLTSTGEKWQKRRKILTPAFHFNILRQFCKTFDEQSKVLVKNIESQQECVIDIVSLITNFTINSICETAMGTQITSSGKWSFEDYKNAIYDIGFYIFERTIRVWIHNDRLFKLSSWYSKQQAALSILHDFSKAVIQQRRSERESGQAVKIEHEEDVEKEDFCVNSNKKRLAMLDLLLTAEEDGKIDEAGIMEEVDTFMFEGHDTTAMGTSFALMAIANRKDIQDKIVGELDEIFTDPNRPTTMEDLNNMKYLELCIKESLRLYPSVPLISRHLDKDVKLSKYTIPGNTICHINIYDIHRDSKIYPNPDKFIPERFTLDNCAKRHPFAYIPFSAGPRNCIGQRFAMYELKSVISHILRNFTLEAVTKPNDIMFSCDLVLRVKDPIYVKFVPRIK